MKTKCIEVTAGQPAPFNVPDREGCMVEVGYPTPELNVLVQYPDLSEMELEIFQQPLVAYSYYETETLVPVAFWIFMFQSELLIETNFNARLALNNPDYLDAVNDYLTLVDNKPKNRVTFFILDRKIIKTMRMVSLHPEAVTLFHQTLNKQLKGDYSTGDYILTVKQLEGALSAQELFHMGKIFKFEK